MAAFVGKPWGRYLWVRSYEVYKNGRRRKIRAYLRKWPGTKARTYFNY
jgi:hypothetical protein